MPNCRLRSPVHRCWQYLSGTSMLEWPMWVVSRTRYTANGLVVDRSTGAQVVGYGDWLVHDLDKTDLLWYDEKTFKKEMELI